MSCSSTVLIDEPIRIVKGDVFNYVLVVYDVTLDENDSEVEGSRVRSDLTNAVITHTVELADGTDIFTKVSTDTNEIEINPDQVSDLTKGTALIKYVAGDTSGLDVSVIRYHHTRCVFNDGTGRDRRIVKRSRFYVDV